ncbi:MAG: hypothetical protein WC797_02780 [Candidatus Paceibacterota bacterium]
MEQINSKKDIFVILFTALAVVALSFFFSGVNMNIDGQSYVDQITNFSNGNFFEGGRSFKPLYGLAGLFLTKIFFLTPEYSIVLMNVFFLFALGLAFYSLLKKLEFDSASAVWGSAWLITGYPVLKYGLAVSTDISGWFFATLSVLLFLMFFDKIHGAKLAFATLSIFLGAISKETGMAGLIFILAWAVLKKPRLTWSEWGRLAGYIFIPFVVLYVFWVGVLYNNGAITLVDFFKSNISDYSATNYRSFFYFIFVELATFGLLLPYAAFGLTRLLKKNDRNFYVLFLALAISVIPVFFWPIFISRILYIQFLVILPLALLGTSDVLKGSFGSVPKWAIGLLPVVLNVSLYIISNGGSLFDLLK